MISVSQHAPVKPNSGPQARWINAPSGSRIGVGSWQEGLRQKAHRASYVPQGRTLHILDFENLCAGPYRIPEFRDAVASSYRKVAGVGPTDHVVLGTNPNSLLPSVGAFPGCRFVAEPGPDGADLALLKVLDDVDWVAQRFHRVVIGSGDHCFVPVVLRLTRRGIPVVVVAQKECISQALRTAATVTHLLRSGVCDPASDRSLIHRGSRRWDSRSDLAMTGSRPGSATWGDDFMSEAYTGESLKLVDRNMLEACAALDLEKVR